VILVPGTAVPAGTAYYSDFDKLRATIPVEAVWVNLPRASLSDAQVDAEYVAFAINYTATRTGQRPAVV
jgi:hypothetical protein